MPRAAATTLSTTVPLPYLLEPRTPHCSSLESADFAVQRSSLFVSPMPKVRRSRVKLHDSAPASSGRLACAAATPPSRQLAISTAGKRGPYSRNAGVRDDGARYFRCRTSRTQEDNTETICIKPAVGNKHGCSRAEVPPPGVASAAVADQLDITADDTATTLTTTKGLSRGQRRRAEKRDAWLRKFDFPKYAQKLREEQQRLQEGDNDQQESSPLTGFTSAMRQQLHECDASCNPEAAKSVTGMAASAGRKRVTRRCIQHLAEKEIARYNAVLAFPAFRASPLAVLKEHLKNTTSAQHKTNKNA